MLLCFKALCNYHTYSKCYCTESVLGLGIFAQGHFDIQTRGAGDRIISIPISGRPALSPQRQQWILMGNNFSVDLFSFITYFVHTGGLFF